MPVTDVRLTQEEIGIADGNYTGRRVYQVSTDDIDDLTTAPLYGDDGTTAVPDVGDAWSAGYLTTKVIGKSAKRIDDDQFTFEVTVNYSSNQDLQDMSVANPLARPTRYSYDGENFQEPYFRDTENKPVVNSSGEPFANMPQRDVSRGAIIVSRNEASFSDVTAEALRNKINSDSVTINGSTYDARTLKMQNVSAEGPNVENDVTYWAVTYRLQKNLDTWDDTLEDRGLNESTPGFLRPILDENGDPVVLPYPLDGSGAKKANPSDTPEPLEFKPYKATAFSFLGL